MMNNKKFLNHSKMIKYQVILILTFLSLTVNVSDAQIFSTGCGQDDGFPVVADDISTNIFYDTGEAEVVKIAAELLSQDIERVTGKKLQLTNRVDDLSENAIIVGTIEGSQIIQQLADSGKIDLDRIKGKWESFIIQTIESPFQGVEKALVIAGSDRRGAAYGVFELSKAIGVSPWYWWADVTPAKKDSIYICPINYVSNEPTVKYRGIFINDEDWGLQEWAEYTFDPVKDIGPATYEKVFELLLRLKANCIWPAMHPCTQPFNYYAENKIVADRYAIMMGSSHHEPLLYNTQEWPYPESEWDPFTYMDKIMEELEQRVAANGKYENIYTVGIRGTGDSGIAGEASLDDKTAILEEVIARQRELLIEYVDSDILHVPQVFWPYKEVLDQYNNDMELPDDITLGWVDDNYGYIRQVSNPDEQERSGGSGVYYHISYWGDPSDYLWITSTQPALIANEMKKAADFGGNRIWIFNVGDIKPAEMLLNFCLDLAWDYNKWGAGNTRKYIQEWASNHFGERYAEDIAAAYLKYFQLAQAAKPEHINRVDFPGSEIEERLAAYQEISDLIEDVYNGIPDDLKNAFFETVYYPIIGAGLMNQKFLYAYKSFRGAVTKDPDALVYSQKAQNAFNTIKELTDYYNQEIENGKWNKIISCDIRSQSVYDMPAVATQSDVDKEYVELADINLAEGVFVAPMKYENGLVYGDEPGLQTISSGGKAEFTFELSQSIDAEIYFYAKTPSDTEDSWYITINDSQITQNDYVTGENFEWIKVQTQNLVAGPNKIIINQREPNAQIAAIKITEPGLIKYSDNYIQEPDTVIPAWKFSGMNTSQGFKWHVIEGLSTSENAVTNLPFTLPSLENVTDAPYIEHDLNVLKKSFTLEVRCMPTMRLYEGRDLRIGISLNDEDAQVFSIHHPYPTVEWKKNVLRGYTNVSLNYTPDSNQVKVRLYALDPGIVFDKILIYYAD